MKIEIAESLMLSWLRHAKNCQVVQLNWKPSVGSWELFNEAEVELIMKETDQYFSEKYEGMNLFKMNRSYSQLIQQGEIDALGIELNQGTVQSIYAIDVAFHENGLNYASREETIARVLKKMIRTAMILQGYFNMSKGEIIFASPKVYSIISDPLRQCVGELQQLLEMRGLGFNFSLICNDDFRDKIFNVVTALSGSVSDTSELFMRSIQMYNLFASESEQRVVKQKKQPAARAYSGFKGFEEMKIGVFVRSSLSRLVSQDLLDSAEVERLMEEGYSKKVFNVPFPVLKEYDETRPINEQRYDHLGRARYYAEPFRVGEKQYLLCNHWVEELSRSYFEAWLEKYN
ncbi:hypothetical protein [Paenibacillus oleatilyticus]|uniref:Uncharacterized protein n=1 Tax=Paenibacillus oleatilyticus TaxID=2594886 RepID=A0ABV4VBT4_9BACL